MLLLAQPAFADAWPQRRGHGYYQIGFRMVQATPFYEPNGNRIRIPTLGDYTVSFYALEAGYTVADGFTIAARLRGVEPLRNGDAAVGGWRGLNGNDQRYLAYGAEVTYIHQGAYGLSLGIEGALTIRWLIPVLSNVCAKSGCHPGLDLLT